MPTPPLGQSGVPLIALGGGGGGETPPPPPVRHSQKAFAERDRLHNISPTTSEDNRGAPLSALRAPVPRNHLRTSGGTLECPKGSHATQLP